MSFPTNSYSATSTNTYPNSLGRRITYPSPFFDLSSTYLPTSVRELHQWCEYYFLANPLANTVISKMAEYPVTDIIVEHDDPDMSQKWQEFLNDVLELRSECISVGLDHYTFGVCYTSVLFPFEKELQCNSCKTWFTASAVKPHWKFSNYKFSFQCPSCGSRGYANVRDSYYKNISKLKLHRWSPRNITISFNEITGRPQYYYKPGRTLINDITLGIKDVILSTPQLYIEAIRRPENRIRIEPSNFYAMTRPGISSRTTGYGMPLLLPVLKDLFYLQTLKRAQEAIAMDHIVPLRAVFPQAPSASADPISTLNLQNWRREVKSELVNWRRDPNYVPVLGFPLGHQQIGGDGRALLLAQEIQMWSDMIVAGLGIPRELVFGGTSWSGSNVSLRILENKFLNYITQLEQMVGFVVRKVAEYTGWPIPKVRFRPFKMADDLQRKMYLLQLNQAGKVSDKTLLEDNDLDSRTEDALMREEAKRRTQVLADQQKAQAEMQGEAMITQAKYQQQIQEMQMEQEQSMGSEAAGGPHQAGPPQLSAGSAPEQGQGMTLQAVAERLAKQIQGMMPADATTYMAAIRAKHPDLAEVVASLVEQQGAGAVAQTQDGAMAPLPEQRQPRREASSV